MVVRPCLEEVVDVVGGHAVVVVVVALVAGGGGEEGLCDLCGLFTVWREQFEAVGVEVVGVAGAVLATVGAVRMHEVPGELGGLDQGFQEGVIGLLRRAHLLPELGEEVDGAGVVAWVGAFVFLEPAFVLVLPGQRHLDAVLGDLARAIVAGDLVDVVGCQCGEGLVVAEASGLVFGLEVVDAAGEQVEDLVVLHPEDLVGLAG